MPDPQTEWASRKDAEVQTPDSALIRVILCYAVEIRVLVTTGDDPMRTVAGPALVLCGMLAVAGLAPAAPGGSRSIGPAADPVEVVLDSVVHLRLTPAADSVLLEHGEATIILSMRDIEDIFAHWRVPSDLERSQAAMRSAYQAAGWVQLGHGFLENLVAVQLIEQGKASIRWNPTGTMLPWVRIVDESSGEAFGIIAFRVFYTPDGALVLRDLRYIVPIRDRDE